ncbi:MAG: DnaA regulatory inactivator Hda [Xanthomonadales bacterium]|nr:DnaA regulatory inactivator Hda [Xanthomonadales bacterium]MCC6593234.1 DnaA regulatory inactivator Hda [Xanthomonadales bacterium]MCE7929853.1 DnaA regulatory inactivator Hda [Xanthomonadales bacterium PRO6]
MSQLALALGGLDAPDFAHFWPGGDAPTAARLQALARAPESTQVLLLGAAGHGKSHLLLATCEAARAAGFGASYLPLDRLDDAGLADAVDDELVAVDAIDCACRDRTRAEWLFAQINRQHDRGRALLLAARALPDTSALVLPDLGSRLLRCERLALAAHNDDTRRAILLHRAAADGIPLDQAAADYLLHHHSRDLRALLARLKELDRAALAHGRRITVPLVRKVNEGT